MVPNVYDAPELELLSLPNDLHYRLATPEGGDVLVDAAPVVVDEAPEPGFLGRFKSAFSPTTGLPVEKRHVPRVTLRVSDVRNSTLFFIDRAAKLPGNGCSPRSTVVFPDGRVLGHLTNDHYRRLEMLNGPVDSDGMTLVGGGGQLRDGDGGVLGSIAMRADWTSTAVQALESGGETDVDTMRIIGADGTVWGRSRGVHSRLYFTADAPRRYKALIAAQLIASGMDERLQAVSGGASYRSPEPLGLGSTPYPGYESVHADYMRYQEEYIAWHKKDMGRRTGF